jgi:hypothetical protein
MPTYTLSSGESFDTILLPKGTVLFRGFEMMRGKTVDIDVPFTELFGRQNTDGEYCVDPHHNTFFYPAPYMVDVVNRYSIHGIYIVQYDLELVSMVLPSKRTRNARGDAVDSAPYVHCTAISKDNMCGKKMIHHDPCLSPLLLKEYPHIHGYIAIAANDAAHFKVGYTRIMRETDMDCLKHTVPFVVENARGIQSVPEIVLYPYHVRTGYATHTIHHRAVEDRQVSYAIQHRAELNYFPLLYITEKRVYTWLQLDSVATVTEMGETGRTNLEFASPILALEKYIVEHALQPGGIRIHGVTYKFTVDLRTGFYIASHTACETVPRNTGITTNLLKLYKNSYSEPYSHDESYTIPFHYPRAVKRDIHGFLRRANLRACSEYDFVNTLNRIGASFAKHYMFDIAHPKKYKESYFLEEVFPRPDLTGECMSSPSSTKSRRYTRKQKRPHPDEASK